MATYNNDLRLKEIATGDESNTWGTSTNTNLSLITDAFGYGTKAIPTDANVTFTMPDGAADGVRALYLRITSSVSLTATRTVTLGPNTVSKVWIVENATTGNQSITIAQGSGATVTIANGAKTMLYTDGAGAGAAVRSANPDITLGTTIVEALQLIAEEQMEALQFRGAPVTLTIDGSGNVACDVTLGLNYSLTLNQNVNTFEFTNLPGGNLPNLCIEIVNTGAYTITTFQVNTPGASVWIPANIADLQPAANTITSYGIALFPGARFHVFPIEMQQVI